MIKNILLTAILILALAVPALAQEPKNAGRISPLEAYDLMQRAPETTFMLDVRTREEYALTGHPAGAYNIPWRFASHNLQLPADPAAGAAYQLNPEPNPDFIGVVRSLFKETDYLLIICDNGTQSAQAGDTLWEAGFKNVAQVQGGVWGEKLTSRDTPRLAEKYSANYGKGGLVNGWVYWGLPMSYQLQPRYLYPPDVKRANAGS